MINIASHASAPRWSWPSPSRPPLQDDPSASPPRTAEASIYLVDDDESMTYLYTCFLKGTDYTVRAFNQRAEALAALRADSRKPDLLIMDYLGHEMPMERFLHECRVAHHALQILMASGFCETEVQFSRARPDRFIQKPFNAEAFLKEVRAALAGC